MAIIKNRKDFKTCSYNMCRNVIAGCAPFSPGQNSGHADIPEQQLPSISCPPALCHFIRITVKIAGVLSFPGTNERSQSQQLRGRQQSPHEPLPRLSFFGLSILTGLLAYQSGLRFPRKVLL